MLSEFLQQRKGCDYEECYSSPEHTACEKPHQKRKQHRGNEHQEKADEHYDDYADYDEDNKCNYVNLRNRIENAQNCID